MRIILLLLFICIIAFVAGISVGLGETMAENEIVTRAGLSDVVTTTSVHVEGIIYSDTFRGLFSDNKSLATNTRAVYPPSYPDEISMIQQAKSGTDSLNWPFNLISFEVLIDPTHLPGYGKDHNSDNVTIQTEEKAAHILSKDKTESNPIDGATDNNTKQIEAEKDEKPDPHQDAQLDILIADSVIPATLLSLQMVLAIDQCDENQLMKHSDDLFILSVQSWEEADSLNVSYEYLPKKTAFLRSMEEYLVASNSLRLGLPLDNTQKNRDISHIVQGTDRLMEASKDASGIVMTPDMLRHTSTLTHYATQTSYPDALSLRQRYVYFDSRKANQLSVLPRSVHKRSQFWIDSPTGTIWFNAPTGYSYLFVNIRYTHLGNWVGAHYTTTTPSLSSHTLSGHGRSYPPMGNLPKFISEGEVYSGKTLNRNEGTEGYLVFEVPSLLEIENMYLKIALGGDYGTQIWHLGT
ncbi:DUF4352 domain-containing protein [Methanocalculus sp. MC3]